jgi:hypothetical protein
MQLVAYGAQDIYLTGQPQITFFKSVYRRHTNFATESILQTINGTVGAGSRVSVTVSRNGDLLKNLWIEYDPSAVVSSTEAVYLGCDFSHALLQQLELEIGGQLIDRQYGTWLTVWRELSEVNPTGAQARLHKGGQEPPYYFAADNEPLLESWDLPTKYQKMAYTHKGLYSGSNPNTEYAPKRAYVPMAFWFCKNPGLALPLIALQYHEVKFNINFAPTSQFVVSDGTITLDLNSVAVYADYVYLDTTERRQFAQNAHEYLIDQLQVQTDGGSSSSGETIRLNFNHPVKELIWCGTPVAVSNDTPYYGTEIVSTGGATPMPIIGSIPTSSSNDHDQPSQSSLKAKIVLNGTDRFTERHLTYFTRNQIWDCHTGFGATANYDSIAVYSFALRPEEHQPSGTCNFSRIDNAQLKFSANINSIDIYAVNYNVLRIMSGMGGLAYSN